MKRISYWILGVLLGASLALFFLPEKISYQPVVQEPEPKKELSVEEMVREAFKDDPVMIAIARCESKFRQWGSDGEALRGEINSHDRGIFQINEIYHLNPALKVGIDILTAQGNIEYAKILYEQSGTQPWDWSKSCWGGQE